MQSSDYQATWLYEDGVEGMVVVSALFDGIQSAREAILELHDIGVRPNDISIISRDAGNQGEASGEAVVAPEEAPATETSITGGALPVVTSHEVPPDEPLGGSDRLGLRRDSGSVLEPTQDPLDADLVGGAAMGAGLGAVVGLLTSMASFAIPGVGPFIAAGPLAAVLGGAVVGGAAGGIIGALSSIGVPEKYVREYAARVEQGQTLVSVRTDPVSCDHVERVLTAHGGQSIH